MACRWLELNKGRGVVSFCFDDVPLSACTAGAALLERYQARGTFFVCGGLAGQLEEGQLCHSDADLQRLAGAGHEIGCHTYSHLNCAYTPVAAVEDDWNKNRAYFAALGIETQGFAFPLGSYDFGSKWAARRHFGYSRITRGGTQIGRADLAALRAQQLYFHDNKYSPEYISGLIQETSRQGGWLILYSHEVLDQPGTWGCSPAQLESCLQQAQAAQCRILSVRDAIRFFQQS